MGCDGDARGDEGIEVGRLDELEGGEPLSFELADGDVCFAVGLSRAAEHGVGPNENVVAFSTRCPHMGCPIDPTEANPETGHFGPCVCHQSLFDLRNDGRMVHGRACSNLARVELEVRGERVFAIRRVRPSFGEPLAESDALTTVEAVETALSEVEA